MEPSRRETTSFMKSGYFKGASDSDARIIIREDGCEDI